MARISIPKVGDIYKAFLPNGNIKYFQFISPNKSDELGGDVIRIFEIEHPADKECGLENILSSKCDFFAITYIRSGLRTNYWQKMGHSPILSNFELPTFRLTIDLITETPKSYKWQVWKVPGKSELIGELPDRYRSLPIGGVHGPLSIVRIMERGSDYDNEPL